MGGTKSRLNIFLFHLIALTPLFILILVAAHFALGIMSVRAVDHSAIKQDLEDYLRADRGKFSFTRELDELNGAYDYRLKNVSYKPGKVRFDIPSGGAEKVIYVFGSSPLVSRLFHQSENILFPEKLEEKLNSRSAARFKVHNLGVVSYDSYDIKEMAKALVAEKKPDLILFYEGHMDYEAAYMAAVKPRFFVLRRGFYLRALDYIVEHRFGGLYKFFMVGDWILRSAVEPELLNILQRAGILTIDPGPFEEYNRLILDRYKENLEEVADISSRGGVPLVIVTPIANMEAKPFGVYDVTEKYYGYAMQEEDRGTRLAYLTKARDSEIFTGDLRAKSGLYDLLRGFKKEGVHVMDLEGELLEEGFPFNYEYFYDIGHMKPALHEIVAEKIYRFLVEEGLVEEQGAGREAQGG